VVDGGGLTWQEFAVHAKLYGKVVRIRSDVLAVSWRCTPAMSVSSVTEENGQIAKGVEF
jgi:hypothetical protein